MQIGALQSWLAQQPALAPAIACQHGAAGCLQRPYHRKLILLPFPSPAAARGPFQRVLKITAAQLSGLALHGIGMGPRAHLDAYLAAKRIWCILVALSDGRRRPTEARQCMSGQPDAVARVQAGNQSAVEVRCRLIT